MQKKNSTSQVNGAINIKTFSTSLSESTQIVFSFIGRQFRRFDVELGEIEFAFGFGLGQLESLLPARDSQLEERVEFEFVCSLRAWDRGVAQLPL